MNTSVPEKCGTCSQCEGPLYIGLTHQCTTGTTRVISLATPSGRAETSVNPSLCSTCNRPKQPVIFAPTISGVCPECWQPFGPPLAKPEEFDARALAEKLAKDLTQFPSELREWQEVRWVTPSPQKVADWLEKELLAAGRASVLDDPGTWKGIGEELGSTTVAAGPALAHGESQTQVVDPCEHEDAACHAAGRTASGAQELRAQLEEIFPVDVRRAVSIMSVKEKLFDVIAETREKLRPFLVTETFKTGEIPATYLAVDTILQEALECVIAEAAPATPQLSEEQVRSLHEYGNPNGCSLISRNEVLALLRSQPAGTEE